MRVEDDAVLGDGGGVVDDAGPQRQAGDMGPEAEMGEEVQAGEAGGGGGEKGEGSYHIHGHEGPQVSLWLIPVALWAWYWDRWEEALGQTMPDDPPEVLERTAQWVVAHLTGVVAGVWWAWGVISH